MLDRPRHLLALLALCLVRVLGDGWLLWRDPPRFVNHEEAYNATVGWLLWHTGEWGQLLDLQYRAFCGGCTVVGTLAAPTLGVFGDHFLAWKGLAMLWAVATLLAGFFAFRTLFGQASGWVAAALLALPFAGLSELGLMLWGNHQETALLLLVALGLRERPLAQALVLGLAVPFCRTSLYFVVLLLPLALRRDWRALGPFLLGLCPLLLPGAEGYVGEVPMLFSPLDNLAPQGLEGVLERAGLLLDPRELGLRLFLARDASWAAALVLGVAALSAGLQVRERRFLLPALALGFALAFVLTGFKVPLEGKVLPVVNARYHAPWMLLLLLLPAAAPGRWKALAGLSLLVSLGARGLKDPPRPVSLETLMAARATQPWSFQGLSRDRFDPEFAGSSDPRTRALLRQLEGDIPPAWSSVDEALRGAEPSRGWGQGFAALGSCERGEPGHRPLRSEVIACLEALDLNPEARFGLGMALARDFRDRADLRAAIQALGPEVERGSQHPLAGVDRPLSGPRTRAPSRPR